MYCTDVPRFKLTIEYAGTRYSGWQKQTNARTVQGELERAIVAGLGEVLVDSQGSGRTDSGVHALAQVAHVDLVRAPAPEQLRRRINDGLPADIHVLDVAAVSRKFHARHSAVRRSYVYQIARRRTALAKPYVWWVKDPLDLAPMHAVAAGFVGRHDFRAFADDDPDEKSTVVVLDEVTRRRGRTAGAGARRRVALPVEDGAPHGGGARRRRHRGIAAAARRRLAHRPWRRQG